MPGAESLHRQVYLFERARYDQQPGFRMKRQARDFVWSGGWSGIVMNLANRIEECILVKTDASRIAQQIANVIHGGLRRGLVGDARIHYLEHGGRAVAVEDQLPMQRSSIDFKRHVHRVEYIDGPHVLELQIYCGVFGAALGWKDDVKLIAELVKKDANNLDQRHPIDFNVFAGWADVRPSLLRFIRGCCHRLVCHHCRQPSLKRLPGFISAWHRSRQIRCGLSGGARRGHGHGQRGQ